MTRIVAFLLIALLALAPSRAGAHEGTHDGTHHGPPPAAPAWLPKPPSIGDVKVIDQDGRPLKFYADLVRGRTVAVEFIYTSCDSLCPSLTSILAAVQERYAARGGEQPYLISVSVDPETDTPPVLRAYAARFGAGPGWSFVTGSKASIAALLTSLGESPMGREAHRSTLLIGNDVAGRWIRASGLAPPETLVAAIDAVAGAPRRAAAARYFTNLELLTEAGAPVRF